MNKGSVQYVIDLVLALSVILSVIAYLYESRRAAKKHASARRHEVITAFLVQAYRDLESAANRPKNSAEFKKLESVFADLQLRGSPALVQIVREFLQTYSTDNDLMPLLTKVRGELRKELMLGDLSASPLIFRSR
jgi:hypothetical protein